MDFPCLFNDEYENWDVEGNIQYQYNLIRAHTQGYQWFFLEFNRKDFDLIRETFVTTFFYLHTMGRFSYLFRQNTTINQYNFSKKKRKIKKYMRSVVTTDNKVLHSHPLIFLWKIHQTLFVHLQETSKKKRVLPSQSLQKIYYLGDKAQTHPAKTQL